MTTVHSLGTAGRLQHSEGLKVPLLLEQLCETHFELIDKAYLARPMDLLSRGAYAAA